MTRQACTRLCSYTLLENFSSSNGIKIKTPVGVFTTLFTPFNRANFFTRLFSLIRTVTSNGIARRRPRITVFLKSSNLRYVAGSAR